MGKRIYFSIVLFIFEFAVLGQNTTVSIENLKKHVYTLSSDSLQGRATGTLGQKKAADYLISKFSEYGLSKNANNSYKHYYHLMRKHKNLIMVKNSNTVLFSPWHFHFTSGFNQIDTLKTKLIFAGYASDEEIEPLSVENNAIAFIANSPQEAYKTIKHIKTKYKTRDYFVIMPEKNQNIDKAWKINFLVSKYNLPHIFKRDYSMFINEDWALPKDSVNIFYCFENGLKNILNQTDDQLINLANKNKANKTPNNIYSKIECQLNFNDSIAMIDVENITAMVYGENKNQTIIISAHYDHLGVELGEIYYGADDNASGTSVLLELARLVSKQNAISPFKRSVMFIGFSGEEMGLYGSEAYVNTPLISLDSTIANINMDMVGRWDTKHEKNRNFVYLLNAGLGSKKYYSLAKRKLELPKAFKISRNPGAYEKEVFKRGSDHYSFFKKGVPVSVVFTGMHDDYHTPSDTPDKLNYNNMSNITNMLYQYIYEIANKPNEYPVRFKK